MWSNKKDHEGHKEGTKDTKFKKNLRVFYETFESPVVPVLIGSL